MAKSLDHVLQPDGTYKWELTELKPTTQETAEAPVVCPAPEPKEKPKKVSKKKTDSPISE